METKRRRIGSGQAEQLQQQGAQQQDYYALLELPPTADFDAIKHAYHKLALKYHPDRNKGNEVECETKFKELAAAYAVLSDPEKRSQYDASHQARFWGQSNDMREVFNQFVSSGSTSSFSDFFGSFSSRSFSSRSFSSFASTGSTSSFASSTSSTSTSSSTSTFSASTSTSTTSSSSSSSSSFSSAATGLSGLFGHQGSFSFNKKRPPSKGQNLRTTLHVTFNESVVGCTKTIALKTLVWCSACGGLGVSGHVLSTAAASRAGGYLHQQRSSALECSACGGTGTYSQRSSVVTINSTCSACDGKGIVVDETTKCKCCHHGRVHRTKELRIEVPAGVVKDMRKIYEGEGDVGEYGGVAGDLIVVFDVEDSPLFTREGDDATCDVAVSFFQAALGARLAVPGLHPGQLLCLDVPPGTQPHDVLRIENEGFVNVATRQRGHLYVRVVLDIPRSLTPHQADLLARAQLLWQQAEAEAQEAAAAAVTESSVASEASSDESAATASMMTDYASSSYDETTTTAPTMMATTTATDGDIVAAAAAAGADGAVVEPPEAAAAAAYGGDEVSETAAAPGSVPYEQQQQQREEEPQQHYDAVEPTTTMPRPTMPTLPSMFVNAGLHHHHHHQIPLFDMHMNMHMAAAASAATSGPDSTVVGGYECS